MVWLLVAMWPVSNRSKTEATYLCQGLGKALETSPDPRASHWDRPHVQRSI